MSLVERAIEKMRVARGKLDANVAARPSASQPHGRAAEVSAARTEPHARIGMPETELRKAGYLPTLDQRRRHTSQYQQIKRQLITMVTSRTGEQRANERLIMVTSALAGEGKTYSSINLALSMAQERDYDVLLVDADFAARKVSHLFGIENSLGMLDAARDDRIDITSLIVGTNIRGLHVLPAGQANTAATEYLASERTRLLLAQLASDTRRIVILDSAPLLLTTESNALAQLVGFVVVVVRADSSTRAAVLRALSSLDRRDGVALLFNGETGTFLQDFLAGYNNTYAQTSTPDSDETTR